VAQHLLVVVHGCHGMSKFEQTSGHAPGPTAKLEDGCVSGHGSVNELALSYVRQLQIQLWLRSFEGLWARHSLDHCSVVWSGAGVRAFTECRYPGDWGGTHEGGRVKLPPVSSDSTTMEDVAVGGAVQESYRSNSTNAIAAFYLLVGLLVMIEGIGATVDPRQGVSSAVGIVGILLGVLGVLYGLGVVARMGVTTNNQGVVVRNWVRRRFVRWDEISAFSFGSDLDSLSLREMLSSPMLATYLLFSDGRHIGMAGLSATRVNRSKSRAKVQALLDELDAQRRSFTGQ
jgi:Bacterial PH domain